METAPREKKRIKDSIAISKGYHKIHGVLMVWRRNIYLLILLEMLLSLTFIAFQMYFLINFEEKFCWVLIFLVKGQISCFKVINDLGIWTSAFNYF